MEALRNTNELADEPYEIAAIIKDCASGRADENFTQQWIDRVRESVRSCQELLETVDLGV